VAETFKEVNILQDYLLSKTPAHVVKTTQDFWKAWVKKFNFSFYKLDDSIVDLFQKSLFIMRTHCDDRGGILASGDSDNFRYGRDTYAYVWPRDGAFVALSLDKAGYFDVSRKFYEFCNDVITEDGFLLHKYQPDKSFGSSWHPWVKNGKSQLAIQEDETALLIFGLWEHYKKSRDLEFVEKIYNSFIKSGTDFMMRYLDGLKTHLPFPSYDLWEEKNGVSTFTASSVYGALKAAVEFADVLGKEEDAMRYDAAAEEMKKAIIKELYNEKTEYFEKIITINGDDVKKDSTVDVSGFLGAFRFGVMLPDDPRMLKAREVIRKWLETPIPVGGIARYEGDVYYGVSSDVPGNPWFITTLWMIQYDIALAKKEEDFVAIKEKLKWVTDKAQKSGILSEQIHPYTGEQLSVSPLTWSHAEFVLTIIAYLERLEVLGICTVCYPVK
jgi:GH15 family glucan-1,4-alpha-glucosidase